MENSSINNTSLDLGYDCKNQDNVLNMIYQWSLVLNILLGTPALVWCLWISLSESISGGLKPTQIFPMNLFIVELVFCIEFLLEVICCQILPGNSMLFQVAYHVFIIGWICRPLFQFCICVERYMAVVQPVAFIKYRLSRYRVGTSTVIWGLTIIYGCFAKDDQRYLKIINNSVASVYCLGVVVISLCCFFILRVLKQPGPGEVEGGRGGEKKQGTTDPQKMRAFSIVLTNLVIIVVSSVPVVVGFVVLPASNVISIFLTCNVITVVASPLLHLHREGRLHCRKRPETN